MKEFEVRYSHMLGINRFKVVQATTEQWVKAYFHSQGAYNIYVQEVPVTTNFKGLVI